MFKEINEEDMKKVEIMDDLIRSYKLVGDSDKARLNRSPGNIAYVICSDSRHPPYSIANNWGYVVETAGNRVSKEDLPESIDTVVVFGHITGNESDKGCGACAEHEHLKNISEDEKNKLKEMFPNLYLVAESADSSVRKNVSNIADNLADQGYKVFKAVFNHTTGVIEFIGDIDESLKEKILEANENYRKDMKPGGHDIDLVKFQNPLIIAMNNTIPAFYEYFPGKQLWRPNSVYEVKAMDLTKGIVLGSADYAFEHAFGDGSFKDTKYNINIVETEDDLMRLGGMLERDAAFKNFIDKGGLSYGFVPKENKVFVWY